MDLVVAGQAEGDQLARVLLGEERLLWQRSEERVTGANVNAAAGNRWAAPDRGAPGTLHQS